MKTHETYYSDSGLPCHCGGTIFEYRVFQSGKVETFCYTCHGRNLFFSEREISSPSDASAAHRSCESYS